MNTKNRENQYNILFLSLLDFETLDDSNIYTDLLNEFALNNHKIYIISPVEKKKYHNFRIIENENCIIIKPKIGNIQKTNTIEKGISTITFEYKILKVIKKYLANIRFDLILYTTPPVTFANCIKYVKKRDYARSYLLLKDIFPQNAIDLEILSTNGLKGLIYKFFVKKEKSLYMLSDYIGCMSEANKKYLLQHYEYLSNKIIEVNPNSEKNIEYNINQVDKIKLYERFSIPLNKKIFIYGGNIGKPQGVDFILKCIKDNEIRKNAHFLIVGSGTDYKKIEDFIIKNKISNTSIFPKMPKKEFEQLVLYSNVGMIFLDFKFTIPNFPSRLLTYLKCKKPVLIASDTATDIGSIAKENGFGDYCLSNDIDGFNNLVNKFLYEYDLITMGQVAYEYFLNNYTANHSYKIILNRIKEHIK